MQSNGDELHPNWRALATVHLPLKRFIKAKDGTEISTKTYEDKKEILGIQGTEAKEFYEQVLSEESTSKQVHPKIQVPTSRKQEKSQQPFDRKKFFLYAQQNNSEGLRSLEIRSDQLNCRDEFGWSALMVAACEGSFDAVTTLLQLGADKTVMDKRQNNASELARKKGHNAIVELLESNVCSDVKEDEEETNKQMKPVPFYCDICKRSFEETNISVHQTSTVHQFNSNSKTQPNKLERFNIPNKNRGLQLMVKQGWDRESGLGPSQSGRLYPVKTVIRNKRTGLGIEQPPARVTHFEAYDLRATQRRSVEYSSKKRNRNDIRREKVRDWKRNRRLRNELS